jgi:hypothetical protein
VKVLPRPTTLVAVMVPFIASTRRRTMASPRPVPPKRRVVEASAWVKGWKSRSSTCGLMPMPLSVTSSTSCPSRTKSRASTRPTVVNLSAFDSRLSATWRSRTGSPATYEGTSSEMVSTKWLSCSVATPSSSALSAENSARRSMGSRSSTMRPDSIFEKSRMSLMTAISVLPLC